MKGLCTILMALMVAGCTAAKGGVVSPSAIDADVRRTLQLYPATSTYRILIVPDDAAVKAEHLRIYGKPTKAPAFYSTMENLIVLPRGCDLKFWKHEVGHAVVQAYFKEPVPIWLHEEIAQRAENRR